MLKSRRFALGRLTTNDNETVEQKLAAISLARLD